MHKSSVSTPDQARRSLCPSPQTPSNPIQGQASNLSQISRAPLDTSGYHNARPAWPQNPDQGKTIEFEAGAGQFFEFRRYQFYVAPNHGAELPPRARPFEFEIVVEDPLNPRTYKEKTVRTQRDIVKWKETQRQLKEFGGSCLWCFRNKKKCGPTQPCARCATSQRNCIRSPQQVCLLVPATSSGDSLTMQPPSLAAMDALLHYGWGVFEQMETASVQIYLRRPGDDDLESWCMDLTKEDLDLPKSLDQTVEEFFTKAKTYIHFYQLATLGTTYGHHPLVGTVLKLAFSFITMSCLAGTRIHLRFSETHAAKLTIFLILAVGSRILAESSEIFCTKLCDALRRKDLQDCYSHGKYRPRGVENPLNPLWVATALYYRVVCGLLEIEADSPIATIFGSVETHLVCIRNNVQSILKCIPIDNAHNSGIRPKMNWRRTITEELPVLSFARHFDVAFCLGPTTDEPASLILPKTQGDPFVHKAYNMKPFLLDAFLQPASPSTASQLDSSNLSTQSPLSSPLSCPPTGSSSMSVNDSTNPPSVDSPPALKSVCDPFYPFCGCHLG